MTNENIEGDLVTNMSFSQSSEDNSAKNCDKNNCNDTQTSCNIFENSCSVTKKESNVNVTEQNKKENKNENKNEIKNKSEIEKKDNAYAENKKDISSKNAEKINHSHFDSQNSNDGNNAIAQKSINSKAVELLTHYEQITGRIGVFNLGAIILAIDMHGEKQVKMAIDRALEVNKPDMTYINGILKNWRREGYPNQREEIKNGIRSTGKNNTADKNEFGNFRAKKPRSLTKDERKGTEENLI